MAFDDFELEIGRGETAVLDFAVKESSAADADAQDVSGWSFWCTAKRSFHDADAEAVWQKEVGTGITVTTAASGLGEVLIEAADTDSLPAAGTTLYVDIKGEDTLGRHHVVAKGKVIVGPVVTEAPAL